MQNDELVWNIIYFRNCAFKVTMRNMGGKKLCKNEYNTTGVCSRTACPLANSQYATVLEKKGRLWLYMKTAERTHTPRKHWEKVLLDEDFKTAMGQVEDRLAYWPRRMVARCKARVARLTQVLLRMRRMEKAALKHGTPEVVRKHNKVEHRLHRRERRAERFAKVEQQIEKELLERLKKGTYGELYDFGKKKSKTAEGEAVDMAEEEDEVEDMLEDDLDDIEEFEYEFEAGDEDEDLDDEDEDDSRGHIELEYEEEREKAEVPPGGGDGDEW